MLALGMPGPIEIAIIAIFVVAAAFIVWLLMRGMRFTRVDGLPSTGPA